ncbi:ROK family transcriptional regulator [Amycolatopsis taiwanensis]|uniref:ROK family transcriptional regulator n=1 Tax=Amycolatopsis taiwanensis TaxID=342230 RepID=UPI0004ACD79E|nr:ROK family protein [Amycolatopsis taiwanensis]
MTSENSKTSAVAAGTGPTSAGHMFSLIRSRPGWTRQQLLAATGVSRTTLFERLDQLFKAGLVYEAGTTSSEGGRPAQLLRFDDRDRVLLIFDLGHVHGRIAVADLSGNTLRMVSLRFDISNPPSRLLPRLLDQGDALLAADPSAHLVGVGMGIPAPVDSETGQMSECTTMPGWQDYGLKERIQQRWGVPVLLENDARAFSLGEAAATGEAGILLGVKYSSGIGAGVVVGGEVIGGANGAAGDIGHIRLTDDGPPCTCGRRGCLAAWASGRAIVEQLRGHGMHDLEDVVQRAREGDPVVVGALRKGARRLGRVLASMVAIVNPETLVLGGSLGRLDVVAAEIERQVRGDTVERAMLKLRVVPARIGDEGGTVGLSRKLVRNVYSATAIDTLLADSAKTEPADATEATEDSVPVAQPSRAPRKSTRRR